MKQHYDIAIIGSGIAGSCLATILARQDKNVIVFEVKNQASFINQFTLCQECNSFSYCCVLKKLKLFYSYTVRISKSVNYFWVKMKDAKNHPRFAIGESKIFESSETLRAMAELYDIPELAYHSSEN